MAYQEDQGLVGSLYMASAPVMWKCPNCNKMNPNVDVCRYCGTPKPDDDKQYSDD